LLAFDVDADGVGAQRRVAPRAHGIAKGENSKRRNVHSASSTTARVR
jgi:hypothetical protein